MTFGAICDSLCGTSGVRVEPPKSPFNVSPEERRALDLLHDNLGSIEGSVGTNSVLKMQAAVVYLSNGAKVPKDTPEFLVPSEDQISKILPGETFRHRRDLISNVMKRSRGEAETDTNLSGKTGYQLSDINERDAKYRSDMSPGTKASKRDNGNRSIPSCYASSNGEGPSGTQ